MCRKGRVNNALLSTQPPPFEIHVRLTMFLSFIYVLLLHAYFRSSASVLSTGLHSVTVMGMIDPRITLRLDKGKG